MTFREYLKLAFENADLASGNVKKLSKEKLDQYEWFVGYFLWAVEEVLEFAKKNPFWLENVRQQMLAHRDFFRNNEGFRRELATYSPELQELVKRVINTA